MRGGAVKRLFKILVIGVTLVFGGINIAPDLSNVANAQGAPTKITKKAPKKTVRPPVKKAVKKIKKAPARKAVKKTIRKAVGKAAKKTIRKPMSKAAKKTIRKAVGKAAKKSTKKVAPKAAKKSVFKRTGGSVWISSAPPHMMA